MGHKVFVSYKYADNKVAMLKHKYNTTDRDYVDVLEVLIGSNNIYKGEQNDEDLSHLKEDTIWDKLKDRIYDSSVTVVLISKGMRKSHWDKFQWIPWEIRYSLCEYAKDKRTIHTNGLIAVVLPDENNSYDWMIEAKHCCVAGCNSIRTDLMFNILACNMFNRYDLEERPCTAGEKVYSAIDSYLMILRWSDFVSNIDTMNLYIELAYNRVQKKGEYDICTEINRR